MSIAEFFTRHAEAFSRGDFKFAARQIRVPMSVSFGTESMFLPSQSAAEDMLAQLHRNLRVEDFKFREANIVHVAHSPRGAVRVLLEWIEKNGRGAQICASHGSYFCERDDTGEWKITLIEIVTPPPNRFLAGLPIA